MLGMQSHSVMACNGRESFEGRRQEMHTVQKMGIGKYHIQYAGQSSDKERSNKNGDENSNTEEKEITDGIYGNNLRTTSEENKTIWRFVCQANCDKIIGFHSNLE